MALVVQFAVVIVAAYLIGAIPNALIVGRLLQRTDIRQHGSGNLGATNAWRVLGWRSGLLVLALDLGKGALAVWIAVVVHPASASENLHDWFLIAAAMSAVVGHSYSPYVRFSGGKGVATAAGALLVMTPLAWVILLATFITVSLLSRMVSLGSLVIAVLFPILTVLLYADRTPFIPFSLLAAALVIWRHRSNIGRIIRGEESKISFKKSHSVAKEGDIG